MFTPPRAFGFVRLVSSVVVVLLTALAVDAGLPPGEPLLPRSLDGAFRYEGDTQAGSFACVPVEVSGVPESGVRVTTVRDCEQPWDVELKAPLPRAVDSGDIALLSFQARVTASVDETGGGFLRTVVQQASPDWHKCAEAVFSVGPEWQTYFVRVRFDRAFAAGRAELALSCGYKRQTLELAGLRWTYYGTSVAWDDLPVTRLSYAGREADAPWRAAALERISRLRQSDMIVTVVDGAGHPVPDARVEVEQVRSAFGWGSAMQARWLLDPSQDGERYRALASELFNSGCLENALKWPAWEGDWAPGFPREDTMRALAWLRDAGFSLRGHVLVWPAWRNLPRSVVSLRGTPDQSRIPELVRKRIEDTISATRPFGVDEWDVINEPYDNHDLQDIFGPDFLPQCFRLAREAHPTAALYLNEYANHDLALQDPKIGATIRTLEAIRAAGAPLGGIGLQCHIGATPNDPERVLAAFDRYETLHLPVRVTEFDIDSDDEALQADYTRDFLILAYSHPAVVGVQFWGFWEGAHWCPRAAMYRRDFSEKPAAEVYRHLVLDTWRTHARETTDAAGHVSLRGYQGEYHLRVSTEDGASVEQSFTLAPATVPAVVRVVLKQI